MKIKYFGHSCFLLTYKNYSICIDPFSKIGLKEPNVSADYYFCSHNHYDHNNFGIVKSAKPLDNKVDYFTIKTFHDKKGGLLRGDNNVLVINNELSIAHLGDLGQDLKIEDINKLKGIDILFCPIGGTYTIDYLEAKNLIEKLQPKIVIPMHYKVKGSTVDIDYPNLFINVVPYSINYMDSEIEINKQDVLTNETKIYFLEVNK